MRQTPYFLIVAWFWALPALAQTRSQPQVLHFPASGAEKVAATEPARLAPAAANEAGDPQENLVPFDYRTAEIRWIEKRWQLVAEGVWLKDFGTHEADARDALRLIRDMRLSQHGTIGSPQPIVEYWLADGLAPQGSILGQRLAPLDLASLHVEKAQGQWCLRDARRLFFVFGSHEAEARQALDIIRRHGFTQVGTIGHPAPSMTYFLGGADGLGNARMTPPATLAPRRHSHEGAKPETASDTAQLAGQLRSNPLKEASQNPLLMQVGHQLATVNQLANDRPNLGDRVAFDYRQARLRHEGRDWKLCAGDYTIANFGPSEFDAHRGQNALQYYRLNEHCLIGEPRPSFTFFLANGQAPRGLMFGLAGRVFRPQSLTVRQSGSGWAICDDRQPLILVGGQVEDAKKLLQIIQQQHFDHVCHIGPGEPCGMTLLIRGR